MYCLENVENSISNIKNCGGWGQVPRPPWEGCTFGARKVGCRPLTQWGSLLQNLLTTLQRVLAFSIIYGKADFLNYL